MREILFRGKRVDNGEWVSGRSLLTVLQDNNYLYYIPQQGEDFKANPSIDNDRILSELFGNFYQVDPKTVGQYTGLTDKNDKKIFEGDIVEYTYCLGSLCQILWVQRGYGHKEIGTGIVEQFATDYSGEPTKLKATIKGNIYDNPELLEVE